jgi:hypothetical protein
VALPAAAERGTRLRRLGTLAIVAALLGAAAWGLAVVDRCSGPQASAPIGGSLVLAGCPHAAGRGSAR